jgi:uncharacterized protein YwqG
MDFRETLRPVGADAWLALTLDAAHDFDTPSRDIEWAYAVLHFADGGRRDVFELMSIPVEPDLGGAERLRMTIAGQRELVQNQGGGKQAAYYRENLAKSEAQLLDVLKPTRLMPKWLFVLEGWRVLAVYRNHPRPVVFRVLDLQSQCEVSTFDGGAIHQQVFGGRVREPGEVDPQEEILRISQEVDFEKLTEAEAEALMTRLAELTAAHDQQRMAAAEPLRLRPLAASGSRLLIEVVLTRALVSLEDGRFRLLGRWDSLHTGWQVAARTASGFVFQRMKGMDGSGDLLFIRGEDGTKLMSQPLKPRQIHSEATCTWPPGDTVAVAALGGGIRLHGGREFELPKLSDFDKNDLVHVALSPDLRVLAVAKVGEAKSILLYDLERKLAAAVELSPMETRRRVYEQGVRIPGFALSARELLIVARGEIRRHDLSGLNWQAPLKAPPRIKRGKTPALTLDAALARGPLTSVSGMVRSWFRPGVVLVPKRVRGDTSPVGSSKSGGLPDLPPDRTWPRAKGRPMTFLLQVNLADVAAAEPRTGLPTTGLLSVFLANDEMGFPSFFSDINAERDGCQVIHSPAGSTLVRTTAPNDGDDVPYEGKNVVCTYTVRPGGLMLPPLSSAIVQRAGLTVEQGAAYGRLLEAINGPDDAKDAWATRLGGYPALLQGDNLHLQAESHARGLELVAATYELWSNATFQQNAETWRSLLQLPEGKEGWAWGDAGLMHVLVSETHWPHADFETAWGLGVCH